MDPRKKKLYIILISACLGLSAAILGWNYFSAPTPPNPAELHDLSSLHNQTPAESSNNVSVQGDFLTGFAAPPVFPTTKVFKTSVLDSLPYKQLQIYPKVDISGQLGRTDPFKTY